MRANWVSYAAILILLFAGTLLAYWPALSCGFVSLDDPNYVLSNPLVLAGISRSGWWYAWTSFDCGNWHPLTWLSLELDSTLWGPSPTGYHATNLVFHALNVLLLFVALHQMTGCIRRSACVAALFAVHPLHVESVAWISERKDVLSTAFLLLTILAYVRYAARPSCLSYLPVAMFLTLGLLAKPMLVTAPILLLLLDFWPLCRSTGNDPRFPRRSIATLLIEKIPLAVLAVVDGVMTLMAQREAMTVLNDVRWDARVANMFDAYFWYLQKTFVPTELIVFYPHPDRSLSWMTIMIAVFVVCGISTWVLWQKNARPYLFVGWAWFVVSLLPVIGLLQVGLQAHADRYAYVPHIGLFMMIVWDVYTRMASTPVRRSLFVVIALVTLAACELLTGSQLRYWKNSESLWDHALAVMPHNSVAHAHLADLRQAENDHERAVFHFERGFPNKHAPNQANAHCNWATSLIALNRTAEAEQKFLAALKIDPDHEDSLNGFAKLLQAQGRQAEATAVSARLTTLLERRARGRPDDPAAQSFLGFLESQRGNGSRALVHFAKAAQLSPGSAVAQFNLALAQLQNKQARGAKANLVKALELDSNLLNAHLILAEILEREHDIPTAKSHLIEALRISPSDANVKRQLDRLSQP